MQTVFLVVGGRLNDLNSVEFQDPNNLHYVGSFDSRLDATAAWRTAAHQTVDDALMRYFVVPMFNRT